MTNYNTDLQNNNMDLQTILNTINSLPSAGGGGGGVQPDWNQTDETAADFIKNKPFGHRVMSEIFSIDESIGVEEDGLYLHSVVDFTMLAPGETLKITVNDIVYECDPNSGYGIHIYGNMSLLGASDGTGEPFVCFVDSTGRCVLFGMTIATCSISVCEYAIVGIPQKMLPPSITLYCDEQSYLYESDNTADPTMRLTKERLSELVETGRTIYINIGSVHYTSIRDYSIHESHARVGIQDNLGMYTSRYTAEYTPPTT